LSPQLSDRAVAITNPTRADASPPFRDDSARASRPIHVVHRQNVTGASPKLLRADPAILVCSRPAFSLVCLPWQRFCCQLGCDCRQERSDTMMTPLHLGFGRVLLAPCLVGTIALAQGQPEPTLAQIRSGARPLIVGGVSEYTPFNVVGPDGQLTGMDREIIRAAAKRLGIKQVDFKTMTFSKLGQSLLERKIDVIANNYWPTPDRERLYAFTIPYFVRGGVGSLWIEGTGPFDTAASMAGKRVAVVKGSYPEAWAREHIPT